jgi:trans-2,3-dihydro-3-hydroxyanthranilate isomerase
MTQKPARFVATKLNRATLAETLGLKAADLDPTLPLEFVSTGIPNLMVPIRNRKTLSKIHVNMRGLAQLISRNGVLAYCFALGGKGKAFARGMVPWGLIEDPATGSAGGSLGSYLVEHERLKPGETLTILQGVEMGRPSEIQVEVTSARGRQVPKVSGSAVRVFEGHIDA